MLAVIALYQEWEPFLIAVGFTLVHHLLVGIWAPHCGVSTPFAVQHRIAWTGVSMLFVLVASVAYLYAWRLAEDQRNLSEQVLGAGDGVYGVDGKGRIRFVNEAAMRLIGARDSRAGQGRRARTRPAHRLRARGRVRPRSTSRTSARSAPSSMPPAVSTPAAPVSPGSTTPAVPGGVRLDDVTGPRWRRMWSPSATSVTGSPCRTS